MDSANNPPSDSVKASTTAMRNAVAKCCHIHHPKSGTDPTFTSVPFDNCAWCQRIVKLVKSVLEETPVPSASTTATEDTLRTLRFTLLTIGYGPFMEGIASERAKGKQELAVQLLKAIDESASTTAESEKANLKAVEEIRLALVSAENWLSDYSGFGAAPVLPRTVHNWAAALRLAFDFMSEELSASASPAPAEQTDRDGRP